MPTMINKMCRWRDRRRPLSISTSGRHGSHFGNWAVAAVFIVVVVATPAANAQSCATITQYRSDCLNQSPSAPNAITLSCATEYYQLSSKSAALYRTADSGTNCPQDGPIYSPPSGSCLVSNPTPCSTSAYLCQYVVTTPASNAPGNNCTGAYFVITTYVCNAVATPLNTTTATATYMDLSSVVSNTQINIGIPNPSSLSFRGPTNYTCSIYVPAGLEFAVAQTFFTKSGSGSVGACNWRVEIDDINITSVAQFCNSSSPAVNLGCGANPSAPRFYLLRYVGDSSVSVFFAISLRVQQGNQITVQCGMPPFPLNITLPPVLSTAAPTTFPFTTLPPPAVTTTVAAAASTAGVSTPTPSTPSGNGPSTALLTTAQLNQVATTANIAATSVVPTPSPTFTTPPAAPGTSTVVTTGALTTGSNGDATSPALNIVTTAPPNNVETSTPPTSTTPPAVTSGAMTTGNNGGPTSAAPNPIVTTLQLNDVATSALPTPSPTSTVPPAVTSGAVTTGSNGGATSAVPNPIVTTAPINNVETPTLPTPSTTSSSQPLDPATSVPAISSLPTSGSSTNGVVSPPFAPTAGGVSGWDQNSIIGVITGSVVAGAVVLTIVVAVALYRRRSIGDRALLKVDESQSSGDVQATTIEPVRASNYQLDPHVYNTGPYRHVTGFYVTGNSRSNLVINRQPPPPPPPPSQPFKTVVRLQ